MPLGWQGWAKIPAEDGIYLVVDGFAVVKGNSFETAGTSNIGNNIQSIIQLYRREDADFIKGLRGSFALALWDSNRERLFLATDPLGTKSLYYWCSGKKIAFAPRLSWLASTPEIPISLDPNSLYFYLNHSFIPAPFTIYQSIRRLEPGQCLSWSQGRASIRQYWDITYEEEPKLTEREAASMVRTSLEESLRFLLQCGMGEVDGLGSFLSGGTDSSTVLGLLSQIKGEPIQSFSVGFDEGGYNEIHYARVAASHFKSLAHETFVRPKEALDAIPALAEAFDEPFGNSSALPTYFCLDMARQAGVNVMFAGDGGDELFGGNERYTTEKVFSLYQEIPGALRRWIDFGAEVLPPLFHLRKFKNYVRKANQPAIERFFAYQLYFRDHAHEYLCDEFMESLDVEFPLEVPKRHYKRAGNVSPLNRLLYVDLKLAIADNDLIKVNRMAERHGVDVRYPFLDPLVSQAAGKLPVGMKVKGWSKRYIFKKAFKNLLPAEILRKKKHGFGLPTGDWLRDDPGFRDLARSLLLDARSVQRGYFKRAALEKLLQLHAGETSSYYGSHIWNFIMLELWHQTHADKNAALS